MCTGGTVSRREFKTDIDYVTDAERVALADEALHTRLAEYRYKTEPEGTRRHLGFIIDDQSPSSPAVARSLRVDSSLLLLARKTAAAEIRPIDDIRSTARYRTAVANNLVAEFLGQLGASGKRDRE